MKKFKNKLDRRGCLDESQITRYVSQQCSLQEHKEIEAHLVKCPLCRSEVASTIKNKQTIEDETKWDELPKHLSQKFMEFVIPKPTVPILEICLRFIQEKWEIIKHTGIIIPQPVLAARGDTTEKKEMILKVGKEIDEFWIEADAIGSADGTIDLKISVTSTKDGAFVPGVEFSLKDEKTQRIIEESIQDGKISFDGLVPSVYSIRIARQENVIGEISLDLT